MKKQHFNPEFQVIRQDKANAKFFVASGSDFQNGGTQAASGSNVASSYETGEGTSNDLTM